MEGKRSVITNKQGRNKVLPTNALCIGGEGGIAGLFVFGGALAIAGFMAVASFASNKQKAKATHDQQTKSKPQQLLLDEHECKTEDDHDTTRSLTSLVKNSSIGNGDATCYWTSNTSIDQEEKSELRPRSGDQESPTCFQPQEIVFSDSSPPQSAASSNGSGVAEECIVSLFNRPSGQEQEPDQKDEIPQDDLTSSETETETEDDEEEEDEMMSDEVSESGSEDTSKETGTTSLDYKEEQVWPSELVQHAKQKFKGDRHLCSLSDVDSSDYEEEVTMAHQADLDQNLNLMVPNNQALTWVFPLLLLALLMLLVLLTYRPQESFYVLDDEGHSVVRRI
ncbi:hypothetical protein LR48_Vigan03g281900 [Vigna angularis]|uniref:Uncharacterized protein n=2 Tax=Phaseolus angularis TaxID=3914 RepID=A0A0L9UA24_PHAAN|nr:lisH domain-containing protein C1711.05 [Vigna angularis]KOM39437.1 hypothetical protein LR48_Vigan03g281900 [Vigna angularis]BAT86282.1 hypothetical protein VIGAN_04391800 [Vigna angularis var. angularis]